MEAGVRTWSVNTPIFPRFSISAQSSSCHGRPVRDTMVMSSYDTFSSCESICNELNEGRSVISASGIRLSIVEANP